MLRLSALCLLLLGACTTISETPTGTPIEQVLQRYGTPTSVCPAQHPTRYIWSQQPNGRYAWAIEVDANKQVTHASQVLTDHEFARLQIGVWTKEQVRCHFGPPAERSITPYRGIKRLVWSYRYKQNSVWESLMHVYFDENGVVQHYHPGPDPQVIDEWNLW